MSVNYTSILKKHGFPKPDIADHLLTFEYEIHGVMFDSNSPFDRNLSTIASRPDSAESLILSKLALKPGYTIHDGVSALKDIWYRWLRYQKPLLECFEIKYFQRSASVRILTIDNKNACTLHFIVKTQSDH